MILEIFHVFKSWRWGDRQSTACWFKILFKDLTRVLRDNYVSVLPGESKTVMLDYTPSAANANVLVSLERWNGEEQFISIEWDACLCNWQIGEADILNLAQVIGLILQILPGRRLTNVIMVSLPFLPIVLFLNNRHKNLNCYWDTKGKNSRGFHRTLGSKPTVWTHLLKAYIHLKCHKIFLILPIRLLCLASFLKHIPSIHLTLLLSRWHSAGKTSYKGFSAFVCCLPAFYTE